jgi:trimethylamine--corrinoid protein Co-methyltransferase
MPQLTVLNDESIAAIHRTTVRILEKIGVVLTLPEARELLGAAGAVIRKDRVCLPPKLVEHALGLCPQQVAVRGRGGSTVVLGDGSLHWHNLGGAHAVYDPVAGRHRAAVLQDNRDSARLLDALESVTTVVPFFTPQDVAGGVMIPAMYRHTVPYTLKPVQGPAVMTPVEVRYIVRMASVIGPPSEVLTLSASPVSPLTFSDGVAGAMMEIARQHIPFGPLPCPIAGATSPLSLAGALAQQNAAILAAIVLAQLVRPGLPVLYCARLSMMEPRTGLSVWGGVETGLASAAAVQLGHSYRLPVNVYGLCTNAHVLSMQNGYERALNAVVPALAGADELSGIGESEAGSVGSYAQMVCDDEIAAGIRRLLRGFSTDDQALALDVIAEVMGETGHFMAHEHTVDFLNKREIFVPPLAERRRWEEWDRTGRQGFTERAQDRAERLLAEHEVEPLAADQERELELLMRHAEKELLAA